MRVSSQSRRRGGWGLGALVAAVLVGAVLVARTPAAAQEVPSAATPASSAATPDATLPAPAEGAESETPAHDWLDDLTILVFVDAFVAAHWTLPSALSGDHAAQLPQRVYDVLGGPTVALMSLDVSYAPSPIGATLGLRFGSSEYRWLGAFSGLPQGLQFLQQAFVSWRPIDQLQIDFGEFVTPYGAEVGETWNNVTYTLGSLFQLVQPFYHAGFRVVWQPTPGFTLTALAVNGYNNIVDNNDGKTGGLQATFVEGPWLVSVGYLTGPEQSPVPGDPTVTPPVPAVPGVDGRMRHLVDAVVTLEVDTLRLVLNGNYRVEDLGGAWTTLFGSPFVAGPGGPQYQTLWGLSLGANYRIVPEVGLGARVEYVGQPDIPESQGRDLVTGTFTIDVLPLEHLVIRLDNRIDWVSGPGAFPDAAGRGTNTFVASSVLGVVVHSN